MIFVNFDSIFFHGIEYCRIDEMKTIPWKFWPDGYNLEFNAQTFNLVLKEQSLFTGRGPISTGSPSINNDGFSTQIIMSPYIISCFYQRKL